MDPMTAPLGEVLDWLAERDGWEVRGGLCYGPGGQFCLSNPITLDRIAGMLPEPWEWSDINQRGGTWWASAWRSHSYKDEQGEAPTELEARARVVAAVLGRQDQP